MTTINDKIIQFEDHISELEERIRYLTKGKWGLTWNDEKQDVINHLETHHPVLIPYTNKELHSSLPSTNMLIQGDNYTSLAVLNYTHHKEIDMIYIDPPYNTGGSLIYNNNYVEKDADNRHSKFLSILYHRIKIAKPLLKKNGVICCTIDDAELLSVLAVLEKLDAKIIKIVVINIKPEGRNQELHIMTSHEYAIFATWGNPNEVESRRILRRDIETVGKYPEVAKDGREYKWDTFDRRGDTKQNQKQESRYYEIYVNRKTLDISAKPKKGYEPVTPPHIWSMLPEDFEIELTNRDPDTGEEIDPDRDMSDPEFKAEINKKKEIIIKFRKYKKYFNKPTATWISSDYNPQAYGAKLVKKMVGTKFDFPKSVYAVYDCLDLFLPENGTVLDFFAGSGTTGHAIQLLNMRDNDMEKAFRKKYGDQYHTNHEFLKTDAKLYASFEPAHKPKGSRKKDLSPSVLSEKWLQWRKQKSHRKFILCTNNEIPEKTLKKIRPTGRKEWEKLTEKEKKKELESPKGICQQITYPRLLALFKGFNHSKTEVLRYLIPLTYQGYITEWLTKKFGSKFPGIAFNMKFYKIDFVDAKPNDANKKKLSDASTEMLCIKEDCFKEIKSPKPKLFRIFAQPVIPKFLFIIYDNDGIQPCIDMIKKDPPPDETNVAVYVHSLDESAAEDEFEEAGLENKVTLIPIPSGIISTFNRIQNQYSINE